MLPAVLKLALPCLAACCATCCCADLSGLVAQVTLLAATFPLSLFLIPWWGRFIVARPREASGANTVQLPDGSYICVSTSGTGKPFLDAGLDPAAVVFVAVAFWMTCFLLHLCRSLQGRSLCKMEMV